jgi:NADH:ubiquinone oxidoreductase subunit 6 (subunit J)
MRTPGARPGYPRIFNPDPSAFRLSLLSQFAIPCYVGAMLDWFYVFAAVVAVGAGVVCFARNLMRAAMGLLAVMAGLAGFYVRLHAEFLGVVQLAMMAGGLLTAIVVGIVLTRKSRLQRALPLSRRRSVLRWGEIFAGVFFGALIAAGLILLVTHVNWELGTGGVGWAVPATWAH